MKDDYFTSLHDAPRKEVTPQYLLQETKKDIQKHGAYLLVPLLLLIAFFWFIGNIIANGN